MSVFDIPTKQTGDTVSAEELNNLVSASKIYKSYVALATQSGVGNPTMIVLNSNAPNYLGDIVWVRDGSGYFVGTLAGAFVLDKTFTIMSENFPVFSKCWIDVESFPDTVFIRTTNRTDLTSMDDALANTPIEIRVYQ